MFFTPGTHLQSGLSHNPLKAIVSPRPIGWISSQGSDGSVNLAPYSYFNAISEQPPMVMFSSAPGGDTSKDSLRNVLETKEFVVNVVSAALGDAMNVSSGSFPYGTNEFVEAGLEMAACETVSVPRVKAAPAALECCLWQAIELPAPDNAPENGPNNTGASTMVIGTITGIHIADDVIVDGKVDVAAYQPLARLGYMDYAQITELFAIQRP
ncbi:MAG: flavin reductase family protein [Alphaproteobacteria bacterium]|nr:flavin reductase family protein [Alphaproteobacteria bacterium]